MSVIRSEKRDLTVVFVIIFTVFAVEVTSLSCYSCDNIETSEDCMNVTDCGGVEVCYARADGLPNGKVRYTVGCTTGGDALRRDNTFCTDACLEDMCNLNKCNIPVSPHGKPDRPPRCLSCDLVTSPGACTEVVQCAANEHCIMGSPASVGPVQIVGKREANTTNNSACSLCCDTDHCNTLACQTGPHSAMIASHQLSLLDDNGTCIDKNDDACVVFGSLNTNACTLVPKVDALCPKTCGICGHFGWSPWSKWSECSQTCDDGTSHRSRTCLYQINLAHQHTCVGNSTDKKACFNAICQTEGIWSEWGSWGLCSRIYMNGTRTRSRSCNGLSQHQGGVFCIGPHIDTSFCNPQACPPKTLNCPDNWVVFHLSCYFFGLTNLTFESAQTFCHARNASLVHIESDSENVFIVQHLKKFSIHRLGWWMGMTNSDVEGTWKWTDTNQRVNFTDWYPGEGSRDDEECCVVWPAYNYKMADVYCTEYMHPLCEIRK